MTNTMWGGRFQRSPAQLVEDINASIHFDQRLYRHDIAGSVAHAEMLAACGIITTTDAEEIKRGLRQLQSEIENGELTFSPALEDIHMNIEHRLSEIIGPAAGRLHTARSRNDQVATDLRLYLRDGVDQLQDKLAALQAALARQALDHAAIVMPGFTHLQNAQPVTFGHHLLAYVEMFARDRERLADARKRINVSPLGAAALAGTAFPIDRKMTAQALGFSGVSANSLDAVSDRDFVLETLAAASIGAMHLSRLAEEIILWCSAQFGFVALSDAFTTGSSIMPQKRNPDAAELVRAKAGRIIGALNAVLIVMKGLPLAYGKDMQEDKEATFDALDSFALALDATTGMISDLKPQPEAMHKAATQGYATATDLADWLVRALNLPFRQAHHVTGAIVALAAAKNLSLEQLPLEEMQGVEPRITQEVFSVLSPEASVASRKSLGGTAPGNVSAQAQAWLERLGEPAKA